MSKAGRNSSSPISTSVFSSTVSADFAKKKKVPEHNYSFWYYFGGICLFLFGIQIMTGIFLLLYYTPSVDAAHESIQFIMSQVKFGWLIRSVHSWTANILVGVIFVHMFSTFFLKAYRPAARADLDHGILPVRYLPGLRLQRLSAALE